MTTYTDGAWGYTTQTLTDPTGPPINAGEWGTVEFELFNPGTSSAGQWGYVQTTLHSPHHPVAVKTATGLKYAPVITKISSSPSVFR